MTASKEPTDRLLLLDGHSLAYRALFALPVENFSTSTGQPTNAVYGFTAMLRKLLREHAPRCLGVAFDLAEPTFRHKAFADYKANRPEMPPDLVVQIPYVKKVCQVLGVHVLELPGFEADDLIATLSERARRAGFQPVIVATDKDLLQLVGEDRKSVV